MTARKHSGGLFINGTEAANLLGIGRSTFDNPRFREQLRDGGVTPRTVGRSLMWVRDEIEQYPDCAEVAR